MILQRRVLSSELHARHWTTRLVGLSASTSSILRGSEHPVRTRTGAGGRTALWQAPSFGNRSTRTRRTRGRIREGRPLTVTVREGRRRIVTAVTGGRLRGAKIEIVETETVAAADGRAERGEETDEEAIEGNVIDVRVAKEIVTGTEAVTEIALPEAMEATVRRDQREKISKDYREPQPWARGTTGRRRVQAAGMLLGVRRPAEPFRPPPGMAMRSPKPKVANKLQDAI